VNTLASAGKTTHIDDRDKAAEQIEIEHRSHPFMFPLGCILSFNFQMTTDAPNRLRPSSLIQQAI
jgi:hypothetical protein